MGEQSPLSATSSVRLGVSPLSWVNEVLDDLGKDTTAETCLTQASATGYAGVELSRIFPKEPAALKGLLGGHGLDLVSGWHSGFLADRTVEEEIAAVREHASLLKACGVSIMVYGECGRMPEKALDIGMSNRLRLGADEWAAYGERLTRFAQALHDEFGLGMAYHHHLMMVAETLDEVRAVMSASGPAVGLLLDTGHAFAAGYDYAVLIKEFGPRINHIHLKDVREQILADVRTGDLSFNDAVRAGLFTVPGDGAVDYGPLAGFLSEGAYSGWLVVEAEQDPQKAPPAATVERAYRFVTETILKPALAGA
ncbi:myo-inosose-2 dehydratase [Paracoccus pantotrophus]|uniref:myo-inosose-2 dehydratase n=1 Tax=Paracoccus pantotrophus TaxID=82367 RepID=UPI0004648E3B|nr:myo-inosose-2 dehydratase [Paracoccus pantotrophus]